MEMAGRTRALLPSNRHPEPREAELLRCRRASSITCTTEDRGTARPEVRNATADFFRPTKGRPCDDPRNLGPDARPRDGGIDYDKENQCPNAGRFWHLGSSATSADQRSNADRF